MRTRLPEQPAEAYWNLSAEDALAALASSPRGLGCEEASARLERFGPNTLARRRSASALSLLVRQFESPIILILVFASVLALFLGDLVDAAIILAIVLLSGLLGFWREHGAAGAVEALLALVRAEAEVRREGRVESVPLEAIVPGDIVLLNAGDLAPGDGLILESKDILVDEAALTGEAYSVEKQPGVVDEATPLARRTNSLFAGTHVVSGTAEALIVRTGEATELGRISKQLQQKPARTGFEQGLTRFGYMLIRATAVLLVVILAANLALSRPFVDSLLFSLALAIGLTPQLLPAIVSISLSEGARRMAHERVIVKRLDAIEDFGSMDVLCTDKTGTITEGSVRLDGGFDLDGAESERVLGHARTNARFQAGFQNPIDAALLADAPAESESVRRLDEIPYDFQRKRLSVLVSENGASVLVTKGAVANTVAVCSKAELPDGTIVDLEQARGRIDKRVKELSGQGYRVLAVAHRALDSTTEASLADEAEMTLLGFLTFADPPKPEIETTLRELSELGVSLRLITGDARLAAAHVASAVGLGRGRVVTGAELDALDEGELARLTAEIRVFAEVAPEHKERIITALRRDGHVVGFLGDGINDAPALHAADVGISVNTAVDVAKESAAIVMLDRGLEPVVEGVRLGRQTFANTRKYAFTTISANFGNMLSMAAAAVVLPFLPLLPRQILLTNFLTDIPSTTIAADNVDPELADRPQGWDIRFVRDFMIVFGLVSSAFDFLTFATLRLVFDAGADLFRSGWFVESVITELAVLLVLRTRRPFYRSRPGRGLLWSSLAIGAVTLWLPYSPLADVLGLTSLSATLLLTLAAITTLYVLAAELTKRVFYRRKAERRGAPASLREQRAPTS
jgi:Mg2+-importing ATPase